MLVTYQTQGGTATAGTDFTNIPSAVVTIAPGQTTALVTVTVSNDTIPEGNEDFTVNLLASNAPIGQSVATGVIQDDDPVGVGLSGLISAVELNGTAQDTSSFIYSITLTQPVGQPVTVSFTTANGSAIGGNDFLTNAGTVVIPANNIGAQLTVTALGDDIIEGNENFFVNLVGTPQSATGLNVTFTPQTQATGVIVDNDQPGVNIIPNTVSQLESNTAFVYTIALNQTASSDVTVTYQVINGTAIGGVDFNNNPLAVTVIPQGQTTVPVTVTVVDDLLLEPDETFIVRIIGASVPAGITQAVGVIQDNDTPIVNLLPSTVSQLESNTAFVYSVSLTQTVSTPIVVSYVTGSGTAMAGVDFIDIPSGIVTFAPGQSILPVTVTVSNDTIPEGNEDFTIRLTATNGNLGATLATGIIQDNDPVGVGLSGLISATELNTGSDSSSFVYSITLTQTAAQPVTVSFTTADGSAMTGADFLANTGTVVIPAGTIGAPVTITASGDTVAELDENFFVNLTGVPTSANGLSVTFTTQTQATGVIVDNDFIPIGVGLSGSITALEGNAGTNTSSFIYSVTLNQTAPQPITVSFSTSDGMGNPATSTQDYVVNSGTVVIPANSLASNPITVTVSGDTLAEPNENFLVNLVGTPTSGLGVKPTLTQQTQGTGVIINDDAGLTIVPGVLTLPESATSFVYTISLDSPVGQPVVVTYQTQTGTAGVNDFTAIPSATITIAPGATTALVTVTVSNDTIPEGNENFTVQLTGSNISIGQSVATGVIQDDDAIGVGISGSISALEGNSGTNTSSFIYSVTLTQTAAQPIT
ncbi:MAG: hypothetical protein CV045_12920, partial [Cyanobacteria bacterium M5B4]